MVSDRIHYRLINIGDRKNLEYFFRRNRIPGVVRQFHPFPLTSRTINRIIFKAKRDMYFIAIKCRSIIALCILRGWDKGFKVPSLGLIVDHRCWGRGVGRGLVKYAIKQIKHLDVNEVRLSVYEDNKYAIRLYKSVGFDEETRESVTWRKEIRKRIIMKKKLFVHLRMR